jgi:hypothetical protein
MKVNATVSKIITNKWVLNIVFVVSLLNVIGFIVLGNINAAVYFILLSVLIRYFSKNMVIVLGVPLILVNLFAYNNKLFRVFEGLENATDSPSDQKEKQKKVIKKLGEKKELDSKSKQGLPITPIDDSSSDNVSNKNTSDANVDESFEVGRGKKGGGYNIDYASTIEDAYEELNNIIGGDGIKKLTSDTQGLMKQQLQLAEAMKSMGPMIQGMGPLMEQAKGILGSMGDKEGLGNIMEMAKKITGSAPGSAK